MGDSKKAAGVHIRITEELRDDWVKACKKQSVNGSALIRKWMQEYVEENKGKA